MDMYSEPTIEPIYNDMKNNQYEEFMSQVTHEKEIEKPQFGVDIENFDDINNQSRAESRVDKELHEMQHVAEQPEMPVKKVDDSKIVPMEGIKDKALSSQSSEDLRLDLKTSQDIEHYPN